MGPLSAEDKRRLTYFTAYVLIAEPNKTSFEAFQMAQVLARPSHKINIKSPTAKKIIADSEDLVLKSTIPSSVPVPKYDEPQTPIIKKDQVVEQIHGELQQLFAQLLSLKSFLSHKPETTEQSPSPVNQQLLEKMAEEVFFKMVDPMVSSITEQVAARVTDRFDQYAHNIAHSTASKILTSQRITRERETASGSGQFKGIEQKLNIVVVGLLPVQENEIKAHFGNRHDFKFFKSESNLHQLQSATNSVDLIFVAADFVSHKHMDCLRGRLNVVIHYGGTTKLKELIEAEIEKRITCNA